LINFTGRSFDCGTKLGFLAANVAYALDREDLAADFAEEIRALLAARRPDAGHA
jgi:UTP--glucose-1-phosphate uridylyltransferase